ncbi:MAG: hypothetical protein KKA62_00385 [Nanoarchaeota archaeon]|nr:hypothetical protein [Nanoarchaeota archaeon]MBU1643895.1 hypothetical protein [Nanoarchaeota archaeon]MBU1976393.1 hypothetical protein [Nanoarchaeota archaeon]
MNQILKSALISLASTTTILVLAGSCDKGYSDSCTQALEPVKRKFISVCENKTNHNLYDGSLDDLITERDRILDEVGCESKKEFWKCGTYGKYGEYEAIFEAVY